MTIKTLVALLVLLSIEAAAGDCDFVIEPANPIAGREVVANWQDVLSCSTNPQVSVVGAEIRVAYNFSGCNPLPPGACQNYRVSLGGFSVGSYQVIAEGLDRQRVAGFTVGALPIPTLSLAGIAALILAVLVLGVSAHWLTNRSKRTPVGPAPLN